MAKTKFYAVRKGRTTGLFHDWGSCQAQVSGFAGSEFKSFPSEQEALAYLGALPGTGPVTENVTEPGPAHAAGSQEPLPRPYAFVDGSYNPKTKVSGYGGFLVDEGGTEHVLHGIESRPEWTAMRNVAGEVAGCLAAVRKAQSIGLKSLHIYYDYMGIEQWATGGWQAKKPETQSYRDMMQGAMKEMAVTFHKVAGHTGIPGNERADQLAKQAVGVK